MSDYWEYRFLRTETGYKLVELHYLDDKPQYYKDPSNLIIEDHKDIGVFIDIYNKAISRKYIIDEKGNINEMYYIDDIPIDLTRKLDYVEKSLNLLIDKFDRNITDNNENNRIGYYLYRLIPNICCKITSVINYSK